MTNIEVDFILQSFFLNNNRIARLKLSLKLISFTLATLLVQMDNRRILLFISSDRAVMAVQIGAVMVSQWYAAQALLV